jgi:hypothetical protein
MSETIFLDDLKTLVGALLEKEKKVVLGEPTGFEPALIDLAPDWP